MWLNRLPGSALLSMSSAWLHVNNTSERLTVQQRWFSHIAYLG